MRNLITLSILFFCSWQAMAQSASFNIQVSTDSVLLGNLISVSFSLENTNANEAVTFPSFADFHVVNGPNTSSSTTIMNGQMSQSTRYTFYLEPKAVGDAYIEPAGVTTSDGYLETSPILIQVHPNPEGIIQNPMMGQPNMQFFGGSLFGDSPFSNDFFQGDPFSSDFFRSNPFSNELFEGQDEFFKQFFETQPIQPDSIAPQPQKKKRKTTRI